MYIYIYIVNGGEVRGGKIRGGGGGREGEGAKEAAKEGAGG